MIIDLRKFISEERPYWNELETLLTRVENDPECSMSFSRVKRFHYLYQRASADLAKIHTFSFEKQLCRYLESLVGRSYAIIHETRDKKRRISPLRWFFEEFPQCFRRHVRAFWLVTAVMFLGSIFGGAAVVLDPDAKAVLMPFDHLQMDPAKRVAEEESGERNKQLDEGKTSFSSFLMTHNTRVSIFALALGITWGIGTIIVLFSNGVMLGAVVADYIHAGQTTFLVGWLIPHGAIEIPAILIASQAGLVLAGALIGNGGRMSMSARLRTISKDLVTLIGGVGVMLVWAGIVEAFFSQYHQPVLPYWLKISFGVIELGLLVVYLGKSGVKRRFVSRPMGRPRSIAKG